MNVEETFCMGVIHLGIQTHDSLVHLLVLGMSTCHRRTLRTMKIQRRRHNIIQIRNSVLWN